ncbi:MAG TPA: apolipoprotein N-acyltransferase [Bacteroidota bacterium]|nr:apolipoprotein N-acyltransferase [Bacteroidota bacterium]
MTLLVEETENRRRRKLYVLLCVISGILLGFSFPPSPLYSFAYVGLVPFLFLFERLNNIGSLLRYSYLMLFVFHLITVYWVGGFTHLRDQYLVLSGVGLLAIHPMFYWIPLLAAHVVRKRFGTTAWLVAFPFFWVGFEYFHSLGEFSFPWLTLGNSQAYDLYRIQIVEAVSVYGLSLLVVTFNVFSYAFIRNVALQQWKFTEARSLSLLFVLILLYVVPFVIGATLLKRYDSLFEGTPVKVGIVQPNIDPFEKWGGGSDSRWEGYTNQLKLFFREIRNLSKDSLDLIVLPETAIPFHILLSQNTAYYNLFKHEVDFANTPVFTGLADGYYTDSAHASVTAMKAGDAYFESFNSATLFLPYVGNGPVYRKVVLVPYAERVPYAKAFRFLIEPLKWGVGISSWGKGTEQTVYDLQLRDGTATPFSGMICYELVYPEYVREFVRKGATFLVVVSNDSWWGNTSGAYQLAAYTGLRAVETRRWIVRCANGGISGVLSPAGRLISGTSMYEAATFSAGIKSMETETFFVRHGDFVGKGCLCASILIVVVALVRKKKHETIID